MTRETPPLPEVEDRYEPSSPSRLGVVALGVLGLLGTVTGSAAQITAPPPQAHELVVLDEFQGRHSHGEMVEQTLMGMNTCSVTTPERAVRRVTVSLNQGLGDLKTPGSLDAYVRGRFLTPLEDTARALDSVTGRAVVHQSQGASESRIVEALWGRASGNAEFRADMARELGVPASSGDRELLQSLLDRVHSVHGSEDIAEARSRLLASAEAAASRGAIRVVSAGNQGELSRTFARLGVTVPEGFFRSDLNDPQTIIVGASDDKGTATTADDTVAALASPDAGALVGIDGVERPLCTDGRVIGASGSSFAAPQVSVLFDKALTADESLTRDDLLERLVSVARPVPGGEASVGAGIVDGEAFLLAH